MTAKYEGHEGHRPSYCWIRRASWTRNSFKKLGRGDAVWSRTNLPNLCSIHHKLTRLLFSFYPECHFLLKSSSPPIYFHCLIIAPPHVSEPEIIISHPFLMHTFIPSANCIKFDYLHSEARACTTGLVVSSHNICEIMAISGQAY